MLSKLLTKPSAFGEPEVVGEGDPSAKEDLGDTVSKHTSLIISE